MWRLVSEVRRLSFILAPITIVLIAGSLIYIFFPSASIPVPVTPRDNLKYEFVKFLVQLVLIVMLGGILIHEYNRGRDRAKAFNEFRKTLLTKLLNSYSKVKSARRILDANIVPNTKSNIEEIAWKVYEDQLKEIIDAQLEFENHYYQLTTFPYTFKAESTKQLVKHADVMEKYLNALIEEYQDLNIPISTQSQPIDTSKLPELKKFIVKSSFKAGFSNHFHSSVKLIQKGILRI